MDRLGRTAQALVFLIVVGIGDLAATGFAVAQAWQNAQESYQQGIQAERAGEFELALQAYRDAVKNGADLPPAIGAYVRMARIFMSQRLDADAQDALSQALQRDPQNSDALIMQARLLMVQDKPRKAARILEELILREPVAIEAGVGLVEAALIGQEPAQIKQAVNRLRTLVGDSPDQRARAAQAAKEEADFLISTGRISQAVFLADQAFSLDGSASNKQFFAMTQYQANDLAGSAQLFQELQADPKSRDFASAMLNQIEAQRKESQLDDKRRRWRQLQSSARESEIAGKLDDAIRSYEEMVSFGKDMFGVEIADVEHKLASAKRRYAEKIAEQTRTQAFEAMRAGRYKDAADILRRAKMLVGPDLVLDGMMAEALLKQAPSFDRAGRESAMLEILALDEALRQSGGALPSAAVASAHVELGLLMENLRRWNEAVRHFEAARAHSSTFPGLSRKLFLDRMRIRLPMVAAALAAMACLTLFVHLRHPNVFRYLIVFVRYHLALRNNDRDGQYRALTALAAIRPHRSDYRLTLARMAADRNDRDVSLYLHEQLRRERSLDEAGMFRLFEMYVEQKETDKMYGVIQDILKTSQNKTNRSRILDAKFRIELESGRRADAFQTGRELMTIKPGAWLAEQMVNLAKSPEVKVDLAALMAAYRTWLRLNPAAVDKFLADAEPILVRSWPAGKQELDPAARDLAKLMIDLHQKNGRNRRAAEILERLRPCEPDPVPGLQDLLRIYTALNDEPATLNTARLLHEAQPPNLGFGMNYSRLLINRGDTSAAVSVFLDLLPHQPNNIELVGQLMETARQKFDGGSDAGLDDAIRILRSLIGITLLDTKESRLLLARSLMKKDRIDEAIAILQAIEGGGYPKLRAQALAAEAFLQKKQPALAAELLSKVNFSDPQLSDDLRKEMKYLQAIAFEEQGMLPDAAEILDELILHDILYRDVKDRHARLSHVKRRREAQIDCASCGKSNTSGARFCVHCGLPMSA